jgi:hypothetical protein
MAKVAAILGHVALNIFTNHFNNVAEIDLDFPKIVFRQADQDTNEGIRHRPELTSVGAKLTCMKVRANGLIRKCSQTFWRQSL